MERPWDGSWGCSVGVVKNERVYSMTFAGLGFRTDKSIHGHGWACYAFDAYSIATFEKIALQKVPSKAVLFRLAEQHLSSNYKEFEKRKRGRKTESFLFYIQSGTKKENMAAFLAATVVKGLE